ncbi:hypothetical protein AB0L13_16695 [Saccharopolyspora shandongensis]|uniref:hypothetical protein n=1 Tax=Saccharopolyspora shandongensis TaxID=418495 RepID=UPI00343622FE
MTDSRNLRAVPNLPAKDERRIECRNCQPTDTGCSTDCWTPGLADDAVRAVLDLHKADGVGDCTACGVDTSENPIPWPCTTVQTINRVIRGDAK